MQDNSELIVHFNKNVLRQTIYIMMFLICGLLYFLGVTSNFGFYPLTFIQSLLALSTVIFLGVIIVAFFIIKSTIPAAILNQDGIWLSRFGFIAWKNVDEFGIYLSPGTPIEVIGIRVNNVSMLLKQASLAGRWGIFWSQIFGYPHIFLYNIALQNDQVISFAEHFMEKNKN